MSKVYCIEIPIVLWKVFITTSISQRLAVNNSPKEHTHAIAKYYNLYVCNTS